MAPPPGGPADKTPPTLVEVSPPSGTTGIEGGFTLTLTFSERLREETDERAIRTSPALDGSLEVDLKKESLTLTFPEQLRREQTYILTLTRDIMDERKNKLDRTYQLAFSTGDRIAGGGISGKVDNLENGSATVYLYRRPEVADDSLLLRPPDYYTETDDSGRYAFNFLDRGEFTVLGQRGVSPPAPISPSRTAYGLYWEESVTLDEENEFIGDVDLRLSAEVPPFRVLSVTMDDATLGTINLVNPFRLAESPEAAVEFFEANASSPIHASHTFQYSDAPNQLRFFTEGLSQGELYSLSVTGLVDSIGQAIEAEKRQIRIPATEALPPEIHAPATDVPLSLIPGDDPLSIQFTKPVVLSHPDSLLTLTDSEKAAIPVAVFQSDPTRMEIVAEGGWSEERTYALQLFGSMVSGRDGATLADSLVNFSLAVGQERGAGGLYGSVVGPYAEKTVVTARSIEKRPISLSLSVNSAGEFQMRNVPAGMWLLSAYQDRDENGRYTYGKVFPFRAAEPFTALTDTVEVRANWDVEGIVIAYPGKTEE